MGQKVNPHGMRVGVIDDWDSKWFAEKDYAALLVEDAKIRQFLKKHLFVAGISKIGIKRVGNRVKLAAAAQALRISRKPWPVLLIKKWILISLKSNPPT